MPSPSQGTAHGDAATAASPGAASAASCSSAGSAPALAAGTAVVATGGTSFVTSRPAGGASGPCVHTFAPVAVVS